MPSRLRPLAVLLVALAADGALAQSEAEPEPGREIEREAFGDWVLACGSEGEVGRCLLRQVHTLRESGRRVLGVTVHRLGKGPSPRLVLTAPLGVSLERGLAYRIDSGEARALPFRVCIPAGCQTGAALEGDLLASMREGVTMKVAFFAGVEPRQITVDVSLAGFTAGFAAFVAGNR